MKKVLLVNENPTIKEYLKYLLEATEKSVTTVECPLDLFEKHSDNPADLVILDFHYKNMDGFSFIEKLKSDAQTMSVPLMIVSEEDDFLLIFDALNMGVKDYLHYPVNEDVFLEKIRTIVPS